MEKQQWKENALNHGGNINARLHVKDVVETFGEEKDVSDWNSCARRKTKMVETLGTNAERPVANVNKPKAGETKFRICSKFFFKTINFI